MRLAVAVGNSARRDARARAVAGDRLGMLLFNCNWRGVNAGGTFSVGGARGTEDMGGTWREYAAACFSGSVSRFGAIIRLEKSD